MHAVDIGSGEILGSLTWPYGNQIFALDSARENEVSGFPFELGRGGLSSRTKKLFYAFGMS